MGNRLADIAYRIAIISRNTVGNCYNAADAIESVVPRFLYGNSAYMAASQLAWAPTIRGNQHWKFTWPSRRRCRCLG